MKNILINLYVRSLIFLFYFILWKTMGIQQKMFNKKALKIPGHLSQMSAYIQGSATAALGQSLIYP